MTMMLDIIGSAKQKLRGLGDAGSYFLSLIAEGLAPAGMPRLDPELTEDAHRYIEAYLWIRSKEDTLIPFKLNGIQRKYAAMKRHALRAGRKPRFLVLKYRRGGLTTYEQALSFHMTMTSRHRKCLTLADTRDKTREIFEMVNRFYEHLDRDVRPARSDSKTELLVSSLDSKFGIHTAGSKAVGRGDTLSRVHGSEVAWWELNELDLDNLIAGIDEAASHGEVILETTANGAGGWFYKTWLNAQNGKGDWTPIFLAWYMDDTNRLPLEPGEVLTLKEEEEHARKAYGLDDAQIKWRRAKQHSRGGLFPQEYPENWQEAFLVSGVSFFSRESLELYMKLATDPIEETSYLRVWRAPEQGMEYFIGADVSEGLPNGDYDAASILDTEGRQCAVLHGRWTTKEYSKKLAALGHHYNNACIAVEANNHGHAVLDALQDCYDNLYIHRNFDAYGGPTGAKLGWQTNAKTRSIMLSALQVAIQDLLIEVNDRVFITECTTFINNGSGKYEARPGCHDDTVIANAIAWQVRQERPGDVNVY